MAQPRVFATRLSSFEESEDDCDQRIRKVDATYRISYCDEEVFEMTPWREADRNSATVSKPINEQTQTVPTHGFLLDKPTETGNVELADAEAMCEVGFDHSEADYNSSAYQRILQTLSIMQNMDNLLSWFSVDSPDGAQVLEIEPHTKHAKAIIDCWYLRDEQLYVLLLKVKPQWIIVEIWPLRNLLIPKKILLPDGDLDEKRCLLAADGEHIVVWCSDAVYVYKTAGDNQMVHKITFNFTLTTFSLAVNGRSYLTNDRCEVYGMNVRTGELKFVNRLPALYEFTPAAIIVRHTFHAVAAGNFLFWYHNDRPGTTYYDTQMRSRALPFEMDIILMEPRHIGVLYRQRQAISVFLLENANRPEYEFHFTNAETVVAACWSKNALYTLTNEGVLSKWILLTHGRKIRERYLQTGLTECLKILAIENDKFFICCKKNTVGVKWNT